MIKIVPYIVAVGTLQQDYYWSHRQMHKQNNDIDYVADNLTCKVVVLYIVKMFDILYIVIITALSEEGCQY